MIIIENAKRYLLIILILFFSQLYIFAGNNIKYNVNNIPDSLKKNAYAVMRHYEKTFKIQSINKAKQSVKYAITILEKNGDKYATFNVVYDKLVTISNIRISIFNKNGDFIEKVNKSDIKDYSAISGYSLYEDDRQKHYKPQINNYPYTIEIEYELDYNGLLSYPIWYPISAYNLSVENSVFKVIMPDNMLLRYYGKNISKKVKITNEKSVINYCWELSSLKALIKEDSSPNITEFVPAIYTAPNDFEIEGFKGSMNSWEQFAKWNNQLLIGKNTLPVETVNEIKDLVEGIDNKIDITKKVYEYVQSKTRYVGIQIGIGGWQPFSANIVDKNGYGDCKALTNYTMTLLNIVGIKSHYTLVKAGFYKSNIQKDFVRNQFNHAFLCVPINNDTIWLECTNQTSPFGYIGNFTDDRDVLITNNDGGKIVHTKIYKQNDNTQIRVANVLINQDGSGKADIKTTFSGLQYGNISYELNESYENQKKSIYQKIDIPNVKVNDFYYNKIKNRPIPVAEEIISLQLKKYASISGNRMFIPINLMNRWTFIPTKLDERKTEILQRRGYYDIDTITYKLPEGYKIESIPDSFDIITEFGKYITHTTINDNIISYVRIMKINKGCFPASSYQEFIRFYKMIVKADKAKLILVKSI